MRNALIVVDVQNDFLPNGALGSPAAAAVLAPINTLITMPFDLFVATQDWHPEHHCSFASTWNKKPGSSMIVNTVEQKLWPDHCIQNSFGADFSPALDTSRFDYIVHKGVHADIDSYSTFFDNQHKRKTGLNEYLREKRIQNLFFAGLATEYCVLYSVLDAIALGFTAYVVLEACCGIEIQSGDIEAAIKSMKAKGAHFVTVKEVYSRIAT